MSFKGENNAYQRADLYSDYVEENDPAISKIEESPNGDFKLAFYVPEIFYGRIIGLKGSTKRGIEETTKAKIAIPSLKDNSNDVVIRAKQRSQVCAALHQIRQIILSVRKKMRPTHFLAVTLSSGEVQERYVEFKKSILEAQLPGIDEGLFISENCLHLTLGVYVLLDDVEQQRALNELEACRPLLADLKTPFELKVKGLEVTFDDPSSTRHLYGRIESPELKKFADKCLAHFIETGLFASDCFNRDTIQMHMRIMNVRFRQEAMKPGETFDAREILKRFGDFDFGAAQCKAVHLCVLGSRGEDKFYRISGSLEF
ncbi:activating signal cointegrator 1 complex subunit 1-like [Drosophila takahashii]|uniref:activating signal cointegrator 1 complex subunit 1-like n=1 Tax=Drosophila takahashii TaxID=29030 RepID=UPI001CF921AF|nr:activating signal cointegrator 1 complex subunit 1-like [Drosophila takahashii]